MMTSWTVSPRELDQFAVTFTFQKDTDNLGGKHVLLEFVMRFALYTVLTAIFLMIIALIVKLMKNCNGEETEGEPARATENSRLLLSKEGTVSRSYGTGDDDLESGSSSSSEDLYDGKICVICYDDHRNCFFIPCGHCIACHACANRIINDESKSCPICRGIIDKVKKLHIL